MEAFENTTRVKSHVNDHSAGSYTRFIIGILKVTWIDGFSSPYLVQPKKPIDNYG